MDCLKRGTYGIIALLPSLVKGALLISIMRAMRERGLNITLVYTSRSHWYKSDAADFAVQGRLVDLSEMATEDRLQTLSTVISAYQVCLMLQIGAPNGYTLLPFLKERHAELRIVDILFDEIGHTVNYFLYESIFDAVIVESHYMRRFIEQRSTSGKTDVIVVESGIDLEYFITDLARPPNDGLVLGYIGRMSPEKNPLGFVDIALRLAPDHPALSFVMFGDGSLFDDVKARVAASGLAPQFNVQPYIQDLRQAVTLIDILVVPSLTDGRPNIIMEANALGRPVLGTPVGGIPELIEEGRNGYLVSPNDFPAFSAIIRSLETNPQSLTTLSASSRETAVARFDRQQMLRDYETVFLGLLSK